MAEDYKAKKARSHALRQKSSYFRQNFALLKYFQLIVMVQNNYVYKFNSIAV